jgi:uncharacterized SAM-binding protein YcdF (DUF218 family)
MKPRNEAVALAPVGEGALDPPTFPPLSTGHLRAKISKPKRKKSEQREGLKHPPLQIPNHHSQRGGIISKAIFLIFLVVVIGLIYVARHPILRVAGRIWIVDQDPVRSDAIVVLGDDNYNGDRATKAAELLKAGWAPRIVASGRFLRSYTSIADLTEHDLSDRGVPVDAILKLTHRAENTRDEIDVIRRLASEKHWRKLLIVTSNYHTRRTAFICGRMFPPDVEVRVIAAPDNDYNPDTWWQTRLGEKLFLHELAGYVVAMWEVRRTSQASSGVAIPEIPFASFSPTISATVLNRPR